MIRRRTLGRTGIEVSPVALGCWPIAGMTSLHVTHGDSVATIRACLELGINFLDTAYGYGREGESERRIAEALGDRRDEVVIATKVGLAWDDSGRVLDGRAATIRAQCEESLRRLNTDRVELLYLHAPDPQTVLAESAAALRGLMEAGKTRAVGLSNCTLGQLIEFAAVCPVAAIQPPYNMLMRGIENDLLPWCVANGVSAMVYWPLMKGLLAGKLRRDHVFEPGDGRAKYPMFQGEEWRKNQDLVDRLREIARGEGLTVSQLVLRWTIEQPGVTCALVGAKRVDQITENAGGMGAGLNAKTKAEIDAALAERGEPRTVGAV